MAHFAVWLEGRGCRVLRQRRRLGLLLRPEEERLGFFTMRVVEGRTAAEASERAVSLVSEELKTLVQNSPDEPWSLLVDSIEETSGPEPNPLGFSWFPDPTRQ